MDNSRLFLFAALVFVGMLMWQQWQADYGPRSVATESAEPLTSDQQSEVQQSSESLPDFVDLPQPADGEAAPAGSAGSKQAAVPESRMVLVETDVIEARIDMKGGVIRSIKLKKYPTSLEQPDDWLELIHQHKDSLHIIESGLRNPEGLAPDHTSPYRVEQTLFELAEGESELRVPMHWEKDGIEVTKTYLFRRGDYLIDVSHEVSNRSEVVWQGSQYAQIKRSRPLETSRLLYTYTGAVYYSEEEKFTKIEFDTLDEDYSDRQKKAFELKTDNGWVAMIQHYFMSSWIPADDDIATVYAQALSGNDPVSYRIGMQSDYLDVASGSTGVYTNQLFVGPKIVKRLEEISPGLELAVDYGWLTFLSKPLYWLLSWYHGFVGNWGVAIILLTLTVKGAFYKLSETSYRSMAKMRKVSPRLKTLKERYGDDRARMNQEMMKLYKEEKINPLGGCLPILVQIPVFIALYWALLESVDLRQAPFILWIQDLSVMDPYYVLPLIMGVSMFIQQKLNPPPPDPIQAKVMMALPFVFTIFFAFFPAGLVLYWVVNNVLSIAQQWVITKRIEAAGK